MIQESDITENDAVVDLYGSEVPLLTIGKNRELVCPLSSFKFRGVGLLERSQYAKLETMEKEFDDDFFDHMLEAAKTYMIQNRVSFSEQKIIRSIERVREQLCEIKPKNTDKSLTFKDREVSFHGSDEDFSITVSSISNSNTPSSKYESRRYAGDTPENPRRSDPRMSDFKKCSSPLANNCENNFANSSKGGLKNNFNGHTGFDGTKCAGDDLSERPVASEQNLDTNSLSKKHVKITNIEATTIYDAVVICVDKINCVWIRDLEKDGLFDQIREKVLEDSKIQKFPPKPWSMDTVYMARWREGTWLRCVLLRPSPLTVHFVDCGFSSQVSEIKTISEELSQIPWLAIRITFTERRQLKVNDKIRVKPFRKNPDGTFFVNIFDSVQKLGIRTEDNEDNSDSWGSDEETLNMNKNLERLVLDEPEFFSKPHSLCTLKDDQEVVIISEKRGELFLRSKECSEHLKKIEICIVEHLKDAKPVKKLKANQLVLVETDGRFRRAIVTKLFANRMNVELVDYCEDVQVDLDKVRSVNEKLSTEPVAYIAGGKLPEFDHFEEAEKNLIEDYISKRQRFTVSLGFEDELDLHNGTKLLSAELKSLKTVSNKLFYKNMKVYKPELGLGTYVCGLFKSATEFTITPSDLITKHIDEVVRSELADTEPYAPEIGEVCLCYKKGESWTVFLGNFKRLVLDGWFRCSILRKYAKNYDALLIDFGRIVFLDKNNVRKIDNPNTEVPALAFPCILVGLPKNDRVKSMLQNLILEEGMYHIDLKGFKDGKYLVEIPVVYKQIRNLL